MNPLSLTLINRLQSGFPLVCEPFAAIAGQLGHPLEEVLETLAELLETGHLSRFGPLYNAERMGGGLTLAAMAVPDADFDRVAEIVNRFPEVAHNYAREHPLNMWFVVATEKSEEMAATLSALEEAAGLPLVNLPKLKEYRLGFQVVITPSGIDTTPFPPQGALSLDAARPDEIDRRIILATQAGLPVVPRPYQAVAQTCQVEETEVLERLATMIERGWIRRIGLVPNHYRLGLKGNGMTVWALPEERIDPLGERIGALHFVSHCYRRPRQLPHWPYNLFAMVHGQDRAMVEARAAEMAKVLADESSGHQILYSQRILKKSGMRLV